MATSITVSEAQQMLNLYINAEKAILKNQSYTIKDRTFTRADLKTVATERRRWQSTVDSLLSGGGMRVRRVLFRDK
jgi:hypothetical protein